MGARGWTIPAAFVATLGAGVFIGAHGHDFGHLFAHAEAAMVPTEVAAKVGARVDPAQPQQVFELRTYTAADGKMDALLARFRDHTMRIFEKHGMTNIGYWTPQDDPLASNTLIYIIAHPSRETAAANWRAFAQDPEWRQVAEESQRDGRLIVGLESVYLDPTDFSPMR